MAETQRQLFKAILAHNLPLIKSLHERGIDLTQTIPDGSNALMLAATHDAEIVKFFLGLNIFDVNHQCTAGLDALRIAALNCNVEATKALIAAGGNVLSRDKNGLSLVQALGMQALPRFNPNAEKRIIANQVLQLIIEKIKALQQNPTPEAREAFQKQPQDLANLLQRYSINRTSSSASGSTAQSASPSESATNGPSA